MGGDFAGAALAFANHLLDGEAWARACLQPFAGQNARFVCGPFDTTVTITHRGTFAAATGEIAATATRALFAGDARRFAEQLQAWPRDVREHALKLAQTAFEPELNAPEADR